LEKFSLIFLVFLIINFVRIGDVTMESANAKIVSKNISKFKKDGNAQGSVEYTVNLKDFEINSKSTIDAENRIDKEFETLRRVANLMTEMSILEGKPIILKMKYIIDINEKKSKYYFSYKTKNKEINSMLKFPSNIEIHFLLLDVYKSFKDSKRDVWKECNIEVNLKTNEFNFKYEY
jgi:hypothetical protein